MKLTDLDTQQITRYSYDEANRAMRIVNVGAASEIHSPIATQNGTKIERIEVPVIVKELQIERFETQVIVKEIEYREIEKPVYIKEVQVLEVQVPVVVKETKIERVEIPVVHKEVQIIQVDKINYKMLMAIQAITLVLIVISRFIK